MRWRFLHLFGLSLSLASLPWLGCARGEPAPEPPPPEVDELVSVLEGRRLFAPRLSLTPRYLPCQEPDRIVCGSLPAPHEPDFHAWLGALAAGEPAAASHPAPAKAAARAHALGDLVAGLTDGHRLDRAIATLEQAFAEAGDGRAAADLSAVYLVRSELREEPLDLLRSVAAARAATRTDPTLSEARFNLALALERLGIRQGARRAWRELLEVEETSGWADEARRRRSALGPSGGRETPSGRRVERERALAEVLPEWAAHRRAGRLGQAREALDEASAVGEVLAGRPPGSSRGGDGSVRDGVQAIREASPGEQKRLARGLLAYRRGHDLARREDHERALRELALAARTLAGTPFASWAAVERAYSLFQQGRYEEADGVLEDLGRRVDGERYPALQGRVQWIRGTIAVFQGRPAEAHAAYHASTAAYARAGEAASRLAVETRWVAALASQGAREEAWRRRLEVLRESAETVSSAELRVIHTEAGQAALDSGFPEASLEFLDEALHHLRAAGEPTGEVAIRRWGATARHRLGQEREALADLARARAALSESADPMQRALLAAEIETQEGRLLADLEPERAVASLSAAIHRFEESGLHNSLLGAYASRARARRRLADLEEAAGDLALAVSLVESRRARAGTATSRSRFLADVRAVYEEAADLAAERGDPRAAYHLAEGLHARTLGDALGDRQTREGAQDAATHPLSLESVQIHLPRGVELRAFLSLPARLLRWRVTGRGFEMDSVPLSATELSRRVQALRSALRAGDGAGLQAAGEVLSDALLGPKDLPSGGIVFVPDGPLHELPFDLLPHPTTPERRLVEAVPIAIAPSASVYARVAERDERRGRFVPSSALVVADPAFPPELFPGLTRLPGARAEGDRVRALYAEARVLGSESATAERLLALLGRQPVVHVAAHAVPSAADPGRSYLALADGPFYVRQLAGQSLGATRVVFLSACSSGRSGGGAGEGLGVFAQALLEAGASAVVGTLWPVEDRATLALATAFHEYLVAGAAPASALQLAKLERLRAGDPPAAWAAFELIGTTVHGKEKP